MTPSGYFWISLFQRERGRSIIFSAANSTRIPAQRRFSYDTPSGTDDNTIFEYRGYSRIDTAFRSKNANASYSRVFAFYSFTEWLKKLLSE
jgi:hypothetical protein